MNYNAAKHKNSYFRYRKFQLKANERKVTDDAVVGESERCTRIIEHFTSNVGREDSVHRMSKQRRARDA
jgi:hypothetical protein